MEVFVQNRERLITQLPPGSAALVFSGREQFRNRDVDYPFRVHSDFYYLTGFTEPEATLALIHRADGDRHQHVFVRPKDPKAEIWTGRRLGVEQAPEALGVDGADAADQLHARLGELLKGVETLWVSFSDADFWFEQLTPLLKRLKRHVRDGVNAPVAVRDLDTLLHEMRLIKQPWELAHMREAARISVIGHQAAMRRAPSAQTEREVEHALWCAMAKAGAERHAFNPIVASGANACVLHYTENSAPIAHDRLLLVDAGAEKHFYAGDITTTFPAGGRFTSPQRELYTLVLAAQRAAIDAVAPGAPWNAPHDAAVHVLTDGLVALGLLQGSVGALIEQKAHERFFMHKTGHWLGLDVHDVGAYRIDGQWRPLVPDMVLTVEPGLYVAPDDETVAAHWRGIGIRIEDDVRVTEEGHEVLTEGLPRTPEEIEQFMHG